MYNTLTKKGYGRIYVADPEHVQTVIAEIHAIDSYEAEYYLPNDLVAPFSEYPTLVYTHKFDSICMNELTARCWKKGIHIFVLDNGSNKFFSDPKEDDDGDS